MLRLSENGEFLQFQAPQLLQVQDSVYISKLMQTMAHIEYQVKMLRLEYDPTDGEVRASIELPLEDAPLTEALFTRCLNGLVHLVVLDDEDTTFLQNRHSKVQRSSIRPPRSPGTGGRSLGNPFVLPPSLAVPGVYPLLAGLGGPVRLQNLTPIP